MYKLFLLGLFLLCLSRAGATRCKRCASYRKGTCEVDEDHCILKNNESCMIKRTISPLSTETAFEKIQTGCEINCKNSEKYSGTQKILTYCCKYRNFCNDPFIPRSPFRR
ncbi:secreted seminal-vesicle Ly-6 protein 1-like [Trichosurus vulpecula]|uniref:secreted seminal-vesicle Ly-6 protein 1-like n=1 Tax=Trichosurus vulpecula TaxID=9337 RepID=UPI00186B4A45|nr:secreted seminal-vesicle Ly-6 protein 1-like [Trichosurus vulpecula]